MSKSEGTIIITGANGSLALAFVQQIIEKCPSHTYLLTVRDASDNDANTLALRGIISKFSSSRTTIEALDLGSLAAVRNFADGVNKRVSEGNIPAISSIICNAFSWSLIGLKHSSDNYELGFQVSHLSHFVLVLKLLTSMNKSTGRIIFLGSTAHDAANANSMNPLGAKIPENIEELVKPTPDTPGQEQARGFQRYGNAKLANVMFMYSLNEILAQDVSLKNITATAMDPGGLPTSRAFSTTPQPMKGLMYVAGHFILPILGAFTDKIRSTKAAAADLVVLTVGKEWRGKRGYFEGRKEAAASKDARDVVLRERVWKACVRWSGVKSEDTVLNLRGINF